MAFEYAAFAVRNPAYVTRHWRRQAAVRRAMLHYRKHHTECELSGRTSGLQVHHKVPVSVNPSMAGDPSNLMVLNKHVHLGFAHAGRWTHYVSNIDELVKAARLTNTTPHEY